MNILVTGADGFLGAHVTRALLAQGHSVGALVLPGMPLCRLHDIATRITLLSGDLNDSASLRPLLTEFGPTSCLHLAWHAEPGSYLHSSHNLALLNSSLALLQILTESGCAHTVSVGTCAEYDSRAGWLNEDSPTRPETLYAATKLSLCLCGEQIACAGGMTFAWARIFYPYGPGETPTRMVPALIRALLAEQPFPATAGEQVRDYVHVEDVAYALVTLLEQKAEGIYNVGSGEPITVRRLMEMIGTLAGHRELIQFGALPYRDWEPPFLCADTRKLRALAWKPRYTLHEGLAATVQWWREQE